MFLSLILASCSESGQVDVELTVTPNTIARGQSLEVRLVSDTQLDSSSPDISIEPMDGFSFHGLQKIDAYTVTFQLSAGVTAPLGKRIVSLDAGKTQGIAEITITPAVPDTDSDTDSNTSVDSGNDTTSDGVDTSSDSAVLQPTVELRPESVFVGQTKTFSLFGTNTHFSASTEISFPEGAGLVVLSKEYLGVTSDGEQLSFELEASASATVGNIIGTVTSPVGDGMETAYFSIEIFPAPTLVLGPSSGVQGEDVTVSLHGFNTHFQAEAPATLVLIEPAAQGVSINLDSIYGITDMETTVFISDDAVPGAYTISATTQLDDEDEVVTAVFTVEEAAVVDTDTEDTDTENASSCNDFEVVPSALPIGTYAKGIRLEASGAVEWITYDKSVTLEGENEHMYLAGLDVVAESKCYASTNQDMSCSLNVGLQAVPGDYEIQVTSGGATYCGTLTIVADDIGDIEIPTDELPTYNSYSGTLDAETNVSDFYAFTVDPGTTAIFHAYSLDRTTMDPVLRLINEVGDDWFVFEDDETPLGIDARMVHYFAEGGSYFLEVGPKLSDNEGDYRLYTYLLTHGNTVLEAAGDNDSFATAQTIADPVGTVVHAAAETTIDMDYYYFETTTPVAIDVVARRLSWVEGAFTNTWITLYDDTETFVDEEGNFLETPSTADPRMFVTEPGNYYLTVEAEDETSGFYALNIRPLVVINEINNTVGTTNPWVELTGPIAYNLTGFELCTFDGDGNEIDAATPCVDLSDLTLNSSGYLALYADDFVSTSLMLPEGAGAVSLLYQGTVMDKVQYGTIGANALAEGTPAEVGTYRTIGRAAGVDSNNNKLDFVYMASPTPGLPNDRTFQSAIPLYGEPAL
ncbi:MAG: hypothetical protein JXX29_03295 [Deltaproteobacteria bacterium]|nr:hypothetical protein [Deltaproteobacteria bacterium]MBN2670667.1 hypothetical protein [Deltaproteobacteria bacterium]